MLIATLTTDYGLEDHYVASLKGSLYYMCSNIQIVDITHKILPFDIINCALAMRNGTKNFPPGSIHITTIGLSEGNVRFLLVQKNDQYYICPDNGIICLIFPDLNFDVFAIEDVTKDSSYSEINLAIGNVCKKISNGESLESIGNKITSYKVKTLMNPVRRENMIRGTVFHIDAFGNVLVNITIDLFNEFVPQSQKFNVEFKNYRVNKISKNYNEAKEGDLLTLFNEDGWLEIAVKNGRAAGLIGLKINDTVLVETIKETSFL